MVIQKMTSLDDVFFSLSLVRHLENFPYSQRIFLEIHEVALKLIKEHGLTEGKGLKKKRIYEHVDVESGLAFRLEYSRYNILSNFLKISYIEGDGPTKTLDLMTSLGIRNIRELERGDEVTRIASGGMGITSRLGLRKILETLTQYQPDRLFMRSNNALVNETIY